MNPSRRKTVRATHGAAVVELAICLPFIVAMVLCTLDLAIVMTARITLASAARAAAHAGATKQFTLYTQSDWRQHVQSTAMEEMQTLPGYSAERFYLNILTTNEGAAARVEIAASYRTKMLVDWTGHGRELLLTYSFSMRQYR